MKTRRLSSNDNLLVAKTMNMKDKYYYNGKKLLDQGLFEEAEVIFKDGITAGDIKCYYGLVAISAMMKRYMENSIQNLQEVLSDILLLCINGDAEAGFILGRCYEMGLGVPQNICAAADYYSKAADMGHLDSAFNLGCLFMNTKPQNIDQALTYFKKAAQGGQVNACRALWYYYNQLNNLQEAEKWLECISNNNKE